jgi:carbonic anhydrase/acetyltransferase-like protein (isoleucine patch superfamily)
MNWYVAESLSSVIRHGAQISHGRRCEGYVLQSGTLFMHKVQLSDDEVEPFVSASKTARLANR